MKLNNGDIVCVPGSPLMVVGGEQQYQLSPIQFDLISHIKRMIDFSANTFGPGTRTEGLLKHIAKELEEIRKEPNDLYEWIDVIILAIDGAWRAGYTATEIVDCLVKKQEINESRSWPDWRTVGQDSPICHNKGSNHEESLCN